MDRFRRLGIERRPREGDRRPLEIERRPLEIERRRRILLLRLESERRRFEWDRFRDNERFRAG